ncbi:patatin family protein [Mycoplasmatota bacterium]|nr:patatin family protein [Mycoplasmatota bacterium]
MKRALVLEGGGFRGMFTAGILDYFLEQKLNFNSVIGVSMGALIGMNYISKQKYRSRDLAINYMFDKNYISFKNLILKGNLVNWNYLFSGKINEDNPFDEKSFHNSSSKFFVNVFNLRTGEVEYHDTVKNDHFVDYIKASASLPVASRKVKIGDEIFFDGGVVDSLAFEKAIEDRYDKTVLILTRTLEYKKKVQPALWFFRLRYFRYPKLYKKLKVRHDRYNKLVKKAAELEKNGELFIIRPEEELGIGRFEKDVGKLKAIYNIGYEYANKIYPDLIKYLKDENA